MELRLQAGQRRQGHNNQLCCMGLSEPPACCPCTGCCPLQPRVSSDELTLMFDQRFSAFKLTDQHGLQNEILGPCLMPLHRLLSAAAQSELQKKLSR